VENKTESLGIRDSSPIRFGFGLEVDVVR